ncbi:MAG TPA: murein L,D-transpeptidase catalytic domain family protein, partial [Vicinamibacterales bacterium]|nr:murein L,D-transpeptidase catalytic domain family protein [Vicinamibacterales bacterium]
MHSHNSFGRRVVETKLSVVLLVALVASAGLSGRTSVEPGASVTEPLAAAPPAAPLAGELPGDTTDAPAMPSSFDATAWEGASLGAIDPGVFATALRAAAAAVSRGDATEPATLTVIDFSKPSTEKRMWVFDLRARTLLFEELVSHGRGSGKTMATSFSNVPESNRSSLGLFRTAETYVGKHGYSLRLDGLEPGVNDRARDRAIVMHAADYVNGAMAKANGYLGRSLGCPAVRPEISRQLIDAVKNGGLLFAYYPDQQWLETSSYLN